MENGMAIQYRTVERRLSTCCMLVPEDKISPTCWMCVQYWHVQVEFLSTTAPGLSAERYEELRGAVQKRETADVSAALHCMNPIKLDLCSSYCLGKLVISLFS